MDCDASHPAAENGAHYVYTCPFYGTADSIWGTDIYTDDARSARQLFTRG